MIALLALLLVAAMAVAFILRRFLKVRLRSAVLLAIIIAYAGGGLLYYLAGQPG